MSVLVETWKSGFFTEDEICQGFNLSHREFRDVLIGNTVPLPNPEESQGLWQEIFNAGMEVREAVRAYGIHSGIAHKFVTQKPGIVVTQAIVVKLLAEGMSITEIADIHGVPQYQVKKFVPRKRRGIIDRDAILEDLAKGRLSGNDIAKKHGVSPALVSKLNPKRRAESRPRASLSEADIANMKVDLERYSVSEVARLYGVSRGYVYAKTKVQKA